MAAIMVVAMITTIDMTGAITIDDMTTDMIDATMIDGMTATGLVTTETTDTCRFTGGELTGAGAGTDRHVSGLAR